MSGKKFSDAAKKFDREMLYIPADAVRLAKDTATAKFDESIDVSFRLGIDPRKADQMVRGTVALPQGNRQRHPRRRVCLRRSCRRSP